MKITRLLLLLPFLFVPLSEGQVPDWTPTSIPKGIIGARASHKAVWTGKEIIIWGGSFGSNGLGSGGRYDSKTNTWRPTSLIDIPHPYLGGHTAVWAGEPVNRMIIYGGSFPPLNQDGGMYDPETDRWSKIEIDGDRTKNIPVPQNVPKFRSSHSAVWTGKEMIVWGGHCNDTCYRNDGAAYDPLADSWRTIKAPSFLAGRKEHHAIWTGKAMLIWGGDVNGIPFNNGGLYDPESDEWTPISSTDAPVGRIWSTAVWTGTEMIVWGGKHSRADGMIYNPVLDRWRPMSTRGLSLNIKKQALGKQSHTAVWTGEEMIVWGGDGGTPFRGYRYHPRYDRWLPVTNENAPVNRRGHSAVWGEGVMMIWAGLGQRVSVFDGPYAGATGGVYRPGCGVYVMSPKAGDRVNREVTFELGTGTFGGALQRAQLVVDGVPHGDWLPVQSDGRVKLILSDELTGNYKLQVKTTNDISSECLSEEIPVVVGPTIKTLRLIHDPVFDSLNKLSVRQIFSQRYGWNDPVKLSEEFNANMLETSGGFAKYEMTETKLTYFDHLKETNGYIPTDDQLFNMLANCGDRGDYSYWPGWQNFEGAHWDADKPTAKRCAFTIPTDGFPLGGAAHQMVYAQSFKPWGIALSKIQINLAVKGSPTRRIKVSVRESLDGPDLWFSYIRPQEVEEVDPLLPDSIHVGADKHNDGLDEDGDGKDQDDDPRDHDEFDDDRNGVTKDIFGRDGPINLPMQNDKLYYLVVTVASEEVAAQSTSEQPDINNHYWISATKTTSGRPTFTDEESKLYEGSTEKSEYDMSAKISYSHMLDMKHLATAVNFNVKDANQSLAAHVRNGVFDEVHLLRSPIHDTPEAVMLGPNAFFTNAPPITEGVDSGRVFVLMGFNYERGMAEMLESYAHRTEGIMREMYGGWNNSPYYQPLPKEFPMLTNWDRFTSIVGTVGAKDFPACGCAHYPPNALNQKDDYGYSQTRKARSRCDDWLTYPTLKGVTKVVNNATWGGAECTSPNAGGKACYHRKYLKWWFTHLPKVRGRNTAGTNPDEKLNNWWRYILEPDYYKPEAAGTALQRKAAH